MVEKKIESPDWSDKVILIAEDMDNNYAVLTALLQQTHINILRAKNGTEAIQMATDHVDAILMDITMPDMNGVEATRKIKQLFPEKIIIAQTAHEMTALMKKMQFEYFDAILSKPIVRKKLIETLSEYLS